MRFKCAPERLEAVLKIALFGGFIAGHRSLMVAQAAFISLKR